MAVTQKLVHSLGKDDRSFFLFSIHPLPELLPVFVPLEQYMMPTMTQPCYVAPGWVLTWVKCWIGLLV